MNASRLRLVTFDVTGTLLRFRASPGAQYGEVGAVYGVLCDGAALSDNFRAHWRKMGAEHPNFGLGTGLGWERWWKMVIAGTFKDSKYHLDDKKLEAISNHLIEVYKTSACWQFCYGVPGLLSYIKSKGITMGVISNFDPRLSTILMNMKLRHYFSFVTTSYEVGVEKPESQIFETAIAEANVKDLKPEECLHIGDKAALDYIGAKKCGWNAVLVDDRPPATLIKKYPEIQPEHLFSSCYQLHQNLIDSTGERVKGQQQCAEISS